MNARKLGYARVSTASQSTDQQVAALENAGCDTIFTDNGISAGAKQRAGLESARQALQQGDIFVVTAIDRAFRSTIDAIGFMDELMRRGVEFQSLTQSIDTRTPEGRKWFIDTASWAEYERAIISRRTKERLAHVKRQGQHLGRPFKLSERRITDAHHLVTEKNETLEDVAKRLNVAPCTLRRGFERIGLAA